MPAEYKLDGTVVEWLSERNLKVQVSLLNDYAAESAAEANRAAIEANKTKTAPRMVRNVSASYRTSPQGPFIQQEFIKYAAICDPGSAIALRIRSSGPAGYWVSVSSDYLNTPIVERANRLDRDCERGEHELYLTLFTYRRPGKEERLIRVDDKDLLDPNATSEDRIDRFSFRVTIGPILEFTENGRTYRPGVASSATRVNSLLGMHAGNMAEGERAVSHRGAAHIRSGDTATASMLVHLFVPSDEDGRKVLLDLKNDQPLPSDW